MSRLLITIAVDAADDPLGAKESAVMALEPLGGIQVLGVEEERPEQLSLQLPGRNKERKLEMSVKITQFEAENIKRIKAVQLIPAENGLTVIGGRNGQGKTSGLDAIIWALGGDR